MEIAEIMDKAKEAVEKLQSDAGLMDNFKSDPIKTIEGLIGIDLPDEQLKNIADMVKAKLDPCLLYTSNHLNTQCSIYKNIFNNFLGGYKNA